MDTADAQEITRANSYEYIRSMEGILRTVGFFSLKPTQETKNNDLFAAINEKFPMAAKA